MDDQRAPLDRVLARIASRLDGAGIAWALVGSAALAVHGWPIVPADIAVRVAADDARRAQDALAGHVVQHVTPDDPGERAWSHRSRVALLGWDVELLGGMRLRAHADAPWEDAPGDLLRARRRRVGAEAHVPVLDLPEQAAIYALLARPERVAQVSMLALRAA